jgi:hypothetical protein
MSRWKITGQSNCTRLRLRVRDSLGDEVLHAELSLPPDHPRALLTLLEGLALWAGEPLCAVISADDSADPSRALGVSWTPTSALIRFEFTPPSVGQKRLRLQRVVPRPITELKS